MAVAMLVLAWVTVRVDCCEAVLVGSVDAVWRDAVGALEGAATGTRALESGIEAAMPPATCFAGVLEVAELAVVAYLIRSAEGLRKVLERQPKCAHVRLELVRGGVEESSSQNTHALTTMTIPLWQCVACAQYRNMGLVSRTGTSKVPT